MVGLQRIERNSPRPELHQFVADFFPLDLAFFAADARIFIVGIDVCTTPVAVNIAAPLCTLVANAAFIRIVVVAVVVCTTPVAVEVAAFIFTGVGTVPANARIAVIAVIVCTTAVVVAVASVVFARVIRIVRVIGIVWVIRIVCTHRRVGRISVYIVATSIVVRITTVGSTRHTGVSCV
ncbi:MAG: hypothetical protein ACF8CY_06755 [Gimesia chilikensis]